MYHDISSEKRINITLHHKVKELFIMLPLCPLCLLPRVSGRCDDRCLQQVQLSVVPRDPDSVPGVPRL